MTLGGRQVGRGQDERCLVGPVDEPDPREQRFVVVQVRIRDETGREQVQVDIYQALRAADGTRTENPDLEDLVCWHLAQSKLPTWVNPVYGVSILTRSTQTDQARSNVRRTIVTLQVDRLLDAPAARERIRK